MNELTGERERPGPQARLFHIIDPAAWASVRTHYRPASLAGEGFIHLSFAGQVEGVANDRYAEATELCVLEIDQDRLDGEIKVEDSYGSGTAFPHLYGPLPASAVVAVRALPREDGRFTFDAGDCA